MKISLKDYESKLEELNKIIDDLESADISLEDIITLYKKGNEIYDGLYELLTNERSSLNINENGMWLKNE